MNNNLIFNKTRLAPTPSGFLHLGNIFSFAVTASLAAKTGARIVLRIDDFDQERTQKSYVQDIFDTLDFLEIPWHEGPRNFHEYDTGFSQRHRMEMYGTALKQLKESGSLFACTCSRTQVQMSGPDGAYPGTCRYKGLSFDRGDVSWRLLTSASKTISMHTLAGVTTTTLPENMRDFIVRKKDGFPAYQLISILDDIYFGIDLVVRGDDLLPSTLAQLYLSSILKAGPFLETTFYHHPLLVDAAGEKLSKSAGATSVHYLRSQNKKPSDIYALIAGFMGISAVPSNWQDLISLLDSRVV